MEIIVEHNNSKITFNGFNPKDVDSIVKLLQGSFKQIPQPPPTINEGKPMAEPKVDPIPEMAETVTIQRIREIIRKIKIGYLKNTSKRKEFTQELINFMEDCLVHFGSDEMKKPTRENNESISEFQGLFNLLRETHNVIALRSEMEDIIKEVELIQAKKEKESEDEKVLKTPIFRRWMRDRVLESFKKIDEFIVRSDDDDREKFNELRKLLDEMNDIIQNQIIPKYEPVDQSSMDDAEILKYARECLRCLSYWDENTMVDENDNLLKFKVGEMNGMKVTKTFLRKLIDKFKK